MPLRPMSANRTVHLFVSADDVKHVDALKQAGNRRERRSLSAIAFTDAVGYSSMAGRDEELALVRLRRDLEHMRDLCLEFEGVVVKNTGDGLMVRFDSATQAVEWALATQSRLADLRADPLPPYEHRIGIHLGDVVLTEDDAFGDGVNIAARLQEIAEPGGICISQVVYDVVRTRLTQLRVASLGACHLKNIDERITVYRIDPAGRRAVRRKASRFVVTPALSFTMAFIALVGLGLIGWLILSELGKEREPDVRIVQIQDPSSTPSEISPTPMTDPPRSGIDVESTPTEVVTSPNPSNASMSDPGAGMAPVVVLTDEDIRRIVEEARRMALEAEAGPPIEETTVSAEMRQSPRRTVPPERHEQFMQNLERSAATFIRRYEFERLLEMNERLPNFALTEAGAALQSVMVPLRDFRVWLTETLSARSSEDPFVIDGREVWMEENLLLVRREGVVSRRSLGEVPPQELALIGEHVLRSQPREDQRRMGRNLAIFRAQYGVPPSRPNRDRGNS